MWKDTPEGWEDFRDLVVYPASAIAAGVAAVALIVHAITYREAPPIDIPPSTPDCKLELPALPATSSTPVPPEGGMEITATPLSIGAADSEQVTLIPLPAEAVSVSMHIPQC